MKLFSKMKDGGPLSKVLGYFLIELKPAFSVVLLRFDDGSREAYHTHAFNAVSWVIRGCLVEHMLDGRIITHDASHRPVYTGRSDFHMVMSRGTTWVISFRGPWTSFWKEYLIDEDRIITLTHGRKIFGETN